jgi:hypothetical protein
VQLQGDCDEAHISWQGFLENGSVPWCRKIAVGVNYTVAVRLGGRLIIQWEETIQSKK